MAYLFKFYYHQLNRSPSLQVRRYRIDDTNFSALEQAVKSIFHIENPTICWYDGEDYVTISSRIELMDAIESSEKQSKTDSKTSSIHLYISSEDSSYTSSLPVSPVISHTPCAGHPSHEASLLPQFDPRLIAKVEKRIRKQLYTRQKMEEWHRKSGLPLKMEVRRSKRPEKIYRLNKTLMIDSCSKPNETNASFMHINASGDNRHFGIVCDGCNKHDFAGDRFKCLDCQNFDLCLACFSSGIHKDHDMLALRTPSWIKKSIHISSSGSRKPSAPESIGSVAYSLRDASTSSNDLISAKVSPFNETSDESSITVHDSDGSSMFSDDRNDPTPDWEVVEANGDGHSESVRAPQANLDVPIQEPPVPSGDLSDMHISEPLLASLTPDTLCDASPSNQQNDQHNPIDTNSRSSTSLPDSNLDGHPRMDSTQRPFEMNLITGNLLLPVLESARQAVNLVDDITIQGLGLSSPPPSASPTPSLLRINNLQSLRDMGFEASRGQSFLNRVLDEVNDNLASATDRCLSGN